MKPWTMKPWTMAWAMVVMACAEPAPTTETETTSGHDEPVARAAVPPAVEPNREPQPVAAVEIQEVPTDLAQPISDVARDALAALPTESITAPDEFYYRSNERRHDLVATSIAGLGGATIGVGADQLYTLAAMSNASLIVGVDYDNRIPMMHAIYQVLVPISATPADLIAQFDEAHERATIARLEAELPRGDSVKILRIFRRIREQMHTYLSRVARRIHDGRPASWLADDALYTHVRALFVGGRVVARTGDVTGTTTLRGVGETLTRLGVPVGVLYFSNAEQFFTYTEGFRANVAALPTNERTLVVRTIRHQEIPNAEGDRWHYVVQDFSDFRGRLETGAYPRSTLLLEDLVASEAHVGEGISRLNAEVPRAVLQRREARAATQ